MTEPGARAHRPLRSGGLEDLWMNSRGHSLQAAGASVAGVLSPVADLAVPGGLPFSVRFWDGSTLGSGSGTVLVMHSPAALRYLLWAPNELGFGRAYVAGELDIEGDIFEALSSRHHPMVIQYGASLKLGIQAWRRVVSALWRMGVLGPPPAAPPEEARLRGSLHSRSRDKAAIRYHYDISNDFYRLVLGETMAYSCAFFAEPGLNLDQAQDRKHDLICRKLGLGPGMRLLDVGCGWGGMLIHAAAHYGVRGVGVTISEPQASLASKRVAESGLSERVEVRLCDYRDLAGAPYDAICSIGMYEHVGLARLGEYFARLFSLLRPDGRLLNHGITQPRSNGGFSHNSFVYRYVFPDGELHEVGSVVTSMQQAGFEVRDVESLREHYSRTLRCWVKNLENNWDVATSLVGPARARVWRLYMAAAALNFEAGRTSIHQVLAVKPDDRGRCTMPPTRASFAT